MKAAPHHMRDVAQANYERLIEVARAALAADPASSLNSIAKTAGVGPGTLYRHFPTRGALIVAVYRAELEQVITIARDLGERLTPVEALRAWCHRLVELARQQHGFVELLHAVTTEQERHEAHLPVLAAISHLFDACRAAGAIAGDIDAIDLQLALSFIWHVRSEEGERRAHRVVDVVLDGFTAQSV
ncbi:TetR/AcrR family transcriptional regulator [Sphingomonas jatrophae]|uniref:Transcriptional regulator, TetR family n=1 Tax=Sphingomonas jatrophae TaxID=1166337 RepID=A0A1I6KCE9_9SPHN|nr:TetR/AcrR family transcriptional regulator [Sphingomonas jatrophae]SFR88891.1 transcriptional regulator, TetR family [Sphingomonas jatrophae]